MHRQLIILHLLIYAFSIHCTVHYYYNKSNKSKYPTSIPFITGFAEHQTVFWDLTTLKSTSVWITKGSDNEDMDSKNPTVYYSIIIFISLL